MSSPVDIARAAWGADMPDWILRLAQECASSTQRRVAEKLGRSAGLISQVLRAKYPGDMASIEDAVRGAFMHATVECPALGTLPTDECQAWRKKARSGVRTNALRVRMVNACLKCPRNQKEDAQ
ncbi:hypothetical protein [Paracoccus denitrificans]|uniref:hypothetical protein n=1 Tax=Paracoccus denitrificans TaxID=266 RepID=UPI0033650A50